MFVLISGSLWRDPAARQSKTSGKPFVALLKSGTPTDAQWCNIVAFDTAAQSELLQLFVYELICCADYASWL